MFYWASMCKTWTPVFYNMDRRIYYGYRLYAQR
nr:MAG TPA: hypothetical protein [Caudoviricetes sp.]